MIEKVNIGQVMNQYQIVTDADHVYVEKGNSQGKINNCLLYTSDAADE